MANIENNCVKEAFLDKITTAMVKVQEETLVWFKQNWNGIGV